jgi:hypothetical protein
MNINLQKMRALMNPVAVVRRKMKVKQKPVRRKAQR